MIRIIIPLVLSNLMGLSALAGSDLFGACGTAGQRPCFSVTPCDAEFVWEGPTLYFVGTGKCQPACSPSIEVPTNRPLDVTFLVATDLHFGKDDPTYEDRLPIGGPENFVDQVNQFALNGARWPEGFGLMSGGKIIDRPLGVVLTGDLTHYGHEYQLRRLQDLWEPGRTEKSISYPVYVGLGNHDISPTSVIPSFNASRMREYVQRRMGNGCSGVSNFHKSTMDYSWDWGALHLVQGHTHINERAYGTEGGLAWLEDDLKRNVGTSGRPVILFQHYGFDGFSENGEWWSEQDRQALANVLKGYNVIAIFSGHRHSPAFFSEFGLDNYIGANGGLGDAQSGSGGFYGVHVTQTHLEVVFYDWDFKSPGPSIRTPNSSLSLSKKISVPLINTFPRT